MQRELAARGLDQLFPADTWPQVGCMRVHGAFAGALVAPLYICARPTQ